MRRISIPTSLVLLAGAMQPLSAQEAPRPPETPPATPPIARRFFERPIDFWPMNPTNENSPKAEVPHSPPKSSTPGPGAPPSGWGQMVKMPDGTLAYQEPPPELVQVLENPTPENIKTYFEWRLERSLKILRAAELLEEYRASVLGRGEPGGARPGEPAPSPEPSKAAAPPALGPPPRLEGVAHTPFRITYFHKQGCPHCDRQDEILAEWLKDKPEGQLHKVEFGSEPELWRTVQVRGTPSLLIQDLPRGSTTFLEGTTSSGGLDKALQGVRLAGSREPKMGETNP